MFIVADVTWLPIRNGVLDGYVSLGVVEHFRSTEEIRQAFSEAARVLALGGRSFFAVPGVFAAIRNRLSLFVTHGNLGMYHRWIPRSLMEGYLKEDSMDVLKSEHTKGWTGLCYLIDGLMKRLMPRKRRLRQQVTARMESFPSVPVLSSNIVLAQKHAHAQEQS